MDFRNFCSKIDVDAIRAKFPPLPDMVTQLKLPKSMSKLKSRKIFRSSRDDVSGGISRSASKRAASADITTPKSLEPPFAIPSSEFVNHTPQRISTISSLVDQRGGRGGGGGRDKRHSHLADQNEESFYRSAGGIDDYCPSPLHESSNRRFSTMSPGRRTESQQNVQMSFKEKVQKSYKDVSEFRLKHIFAKKTVVRQDTITLDHYEEGFKHDRRRQQREEEKRDRAIADNYDFNFKISRRKSEESFGVSTPRDSPLQQQPAGGHKKPLSEQSGDESGMEQSPPKRKPGIAATRFARVRNVPLQMSLDEDEQAKREHTDLELSEDDDEDEEEDEEEEVEPEIPRRPNQSALYNQMNKRKESEPEVMPQPQPQLHKSKSIKKRLTNIIKSDEEETKTSGSLKKRRAPMSPSQSEEEIDCSTPPPRPPPANSDKQSEKPSFSGIKQNLKRFQKSMKIPSSSSAAPSRAESETDEPNAEEAKTKQTKTQQIVERLKRFRSVDNVAKHTQEEDEQENKTAAGSPLHKLQNILHEWKGKVLKKKSSDGQPTGDDDDEMKSPEKRDKSAGTFMRKLQQIRTRKQHSTTDDPDEDEEGGDTYKGSLKSRAKLQLERGVAAASQMPQMTMEKLKESKKYFRKRQDKDKDKDKDMDLDSDTEPHKKKSADKLGSDESDLDLDEEDEEEVAKSHKKKSKPVEAAAKPKIKRHYYSSDDEEDDDDYEDEEPATKVTLEPYQQNVLVPLSRTAWSTKPIASDSTGDDDDDDILPRVLIHQDNSDIFESTLIIAVTRPMPPRSHTTSPYITEIPNDSPMASPTDSPKQSTPETKADSWKPNREIISSFHEIGSPSSVHRKQSKDSIPSSGSRGHSRKHSMDSSSEDSWIKDVPRGPSSAIGLNSVYETEEPWRVKPVNPDDKLYKTKSIDIFEIHHKRDGGSLQIFEDFDDELKNTPVVKIEKKEEESSSVVEVHAVMSTNANESFDHDDSSEELDNADDDNSSRITKILKQPESPVAREETPQKPKLKSNLYGNSRESLMGNVDETEGPIGSGTEQSEEDSFREGDSDDDSDDEYDRPPSSAPSPPPRVSPPPPPLPQRQPSIRQSKLAKPTTPTQEELPSLPSPLPPLPQTKPPIPPNRPPGAPPKIPDRTSSMSKVAKPLVKTASLRLAYCEQVNPEDVGKVNKLISRFEPNGRPRIIPRRPYISQDSEDYSDQEQDETDDADESAQEERDELYEINANIEPASSRNLSRDITPTNTKPILQKSFSMEADDLPPPKLPTTPVPSVATPPTAATNNNNNPEPKLERKTKKTTPAPQMPPQITTSLPSPSKTVTPGRVPSISISSNQSDTNSNFSQPSSEYGSPMAYPSSLVGSTEVTPLSSRKDTDLLNIRRSRRSMTRDDERFYSFDSDEENSYYSISSTGSSRYIVEL